MKGWVAIAITAVAGIVIGFALRPQPSPRVQVIRIPAPETKTPDPVVPPPKPKTADPTTPKPTVETPKPIPNPGATPTPLDGNMPHLPSVGPIGTGPFVGPTGPMAPDVPAKVPVADLKADEALTRRTILANNGEVVSSEDAKDASGKIGRSIVAETDPAARDDLRKALRKALGDRVVLSDAGTVPASTPELKKAEDDLAAARKKRDQARIDFLPQAPALRQIEEDYLTLEKSVAEQRRQSARVRLNILIRPTL